MAKKVLNPSVNSRQSATKAKTRYTHLISYLKAIKETYKNDVTVNK